MKSRFQILGRALVLTAMIVAFFAWASPALSATAWMKLDSAGGAVAVYSAAAGEMNNVIVTGCGTGCIDIADTGATIQARWGWFQIYGCTSTPSGARCTHPMDIVSFGSTLDDLNDMLTLGSSLSPNLVTFVGGGAGNDTLVGGPSQDNLHGNDDDDSVSGGANCDVVSGESGNDILSGGSSVDLLEGGNGLDTATYSDRTNRVFVSLDLSITAGFNCTGAPIGNDGEPGEGDNVNEDVENVTGGSGDDSLYGDAAANVLDGGPGPDLLDGRLGADTLTGGAGIDLADYSSRSADVDVTLDGAANDGEAGSPVGEGDNVDTENVRGGAGHDTLVGDANANVLSGEAGGDRLAGGAGPDRLMGGDGTDSVFYVTRTQDIHVTLDGYPDDGTWTVPDPANPSNVITEGDNVWTDVEVVVAGSGNDLLVGNGAGQVFSGGAGNDALSGGGGIDQMFGDAGDDQIHVEDWDIDDQVSCGSENDSVTADQIYSAYPRPARLAPPADAVASDCESVSWNWIVQLTLGP
ncbi:MAG TPA: calcium-binding protein [Gaiellaceae bacterium]